MSIADRAFAGADTPSDVLRHEHALLLGLADALQRASERKRGAPWLFWRNAVEVLRALAEHHHGKEETVLMAFLEIRGFSRATRPLAGLLDDHRQHDVLLDAVAAVVPSLAAGGAWAETRLATTVERYRRHLERHLEREERTLLPLAERVLCAADAREVMRRFELFVELAGGVPAYARLLALAARTECAALAAAAGADDHGDHVQRGTH